MKGRNYLNSRQLLFQRSLLEWHPNCLIDIGESRHAVRNIVMELQTNTESFTHFEQPTDFAGIWGQEHLAEGLVNMLNLNMISDWDERRIPAF